MRVSEIRVKQIRVNQGLGAFASFFFVVEKEMDFSKFWQCGMALQV